MSLDRLNQSGLLLAPQLAAQQLKALEAAVAGFPAGKPGTRIVDCPAITDALSPESPVGKHATLILADSAFPVRALLFDKSSKVNWALDWHQDRTISVRSRRDVPGFGNWNIKQDNIHVEPPFTILERLLTVRIHLDAVDEANGVLQVICGSHKLGRLSDAAVSKLAETGEVESCPAEPGDCWFYRTPIVHRSKRSTQEVRRRVLQVDFAASTLPDGLEWRGI